MAQPFDVHRDPLIARVDRWSNRLLVVVVLIPFVVSFGALKELAAENGVNYPFMYPLMIDLSLIIFNLIALRSSLHGERNGYAWLLVVTSTVISVMLNVVHAPRSALAMFMAALPPLFILAAFHLVVLRIEQSARHQQAVMSLAQIEKKLAAVRMAHDQLVSDREAVTREIAAGREQLTAIQAQLEQARHEQSTESSEQPLDEAIASRREQLRRLVVDGGQVTHAEMAETLGVSVSTVRRDLRALNGQVKG